MKTPQEIHELLLPVYNINERIEIIKKAQLDVIEETVKMCAENATSFIDVNEAYVEGNVWSEVDKQSILKTINQVV